MTWVRLDDGFFSHPKAIAAGKDGRALFIAGLCYSGANLTDGIIPKAALKLIASMAETRGKSARTLVECGLWDDTGDAYVIRHYSDYQPSRKEVERQRTEVSEKRRSAGRKGAAARWGKLPIDDGTPGGNRDGKRMAPEMAHGMANGWQTDDPIPSHPIPKSSSSTSATKPRAAGPDDDDDGELEELWHHMARQRAQLEHPDGRGIRDPERYHAHLVDDHRQRHLADARRLRAAHPEWTIDRLAGALDPALAERADHSVGDLDTTNGFLAERAAAAAAAVPPPPDMRQRLAEHRRSTR